MPLLRLITFVAAALPAAAETAVQLWDRQISSEELASDPVKQLANIIGPVFADRYLRDNGLEPTEAELAGLRRKFTTPETSQSPTAVELRQQWVQRLARNFKLQRALWRKHGGRVILSTFGAHLAVDGYLAELRALEATGALTFYSPKLREDFYRYLTNMRGDGVVSGQRARQVLTRALWE